MPGQICLFLLCSKWNVGVKNMYLIVYSLLVKWYNNRFNIQQLYALPTLYLCVLYLSENKQQLVATYSINWLDFYNRDKNVYSAVRTGSLNKAVCASSLKGPPIGLSFNNCTLCPHCIYVFCIYLRTNNDLCHLQHKLIGFYNRDEKCLQRGTDWVFR